jgi:hypothetical protein
LERGEELRPITAAQDDVSRSKEDAPTVPRGRVAARRMSEQPDTPRIRGCLVPPDGANFIKSAYLVALPRLIRYQ